MDVAQIPVSLRMFTSLRLAIPQRSHSGYQGFSLRTFLPNLGILAEGTRFRTPSSL